MSRMIERGLVLDFAHAVARTTAAMYVALDAGRGDASVAAAYDIGRSGSARSYTEPLLRAVAVEAARMARAERTLIAVGYSRETRAHIANDAAAPIREEWDTLDR